LTVVPDASVLLKWVLRRDDEPHTAPALSGSWSRADQRYVRGASQAGSVVALHEWNVR